MPIERTFFMIKPDGYERRLVGEIISRIERKGLKIAAMKLKKLTREEAERLYSVHKGKPFFEELVEFVTRGPVVLMVIEGDSAISVVRNLLGPTDGRKAPPGTIRGDYALSLSENIAHASDSPEAAKYEISIFFEEGELV
ncbi:MAG: nucleoside-diphosphate kinase [Desulfurococcales archaeon]|jgi:nucleoside-diphosphate kinase|nr:nucleoside-diphosphate kinase [Desulfurococcales archaeon]